MRYEPKIDFSNSGQTEWCQPITEMHIYIYIRYATWI